MDTQTIITIVTTILLSNGFWALVQARMARKDAKADRTDEIVKAIRELRDKVTGISEQVDKNAAVLARTHILRFNDELINGVRHSQEYFRQQLQDIDTYEAFCGKHPDFENSYATMAVENIRETYKRLLTEKEFKI